jgi:hypothetical protein
MLHEYKTWSQQCSTQRYSACEPLVSDMMITVPNFLCALAVQLLVVYACTYVGVLCRCGYKMFSCAQRFYTAYYTARASHTLFTQNRLTVSDLCIQEVDSTAPLEAFTSVLNTVFELMLGQFELSKLDRYYEILA